MDRTSIAIALVFCLIQSDEIICDEYSIGNACIFDVNEHLPRKNEPLLLQRTSGSLNLLLPKMRGKSSAIVLQKEEKIIISCPGKKNYIAENKEVNSEGSCLGGTKITIVGRGSNSLSELGCNSKVAATTKPTRTKCAEEKGIVVEMGFNINQDWISMVESCHNVEKSHTYYSRHVIHGAVIAGKVKRKDPDRPQFATGDDMFFKGFDPMNSYTKDNQMTIFLDELGNDYAAKYINQRNSFLAKGHLAPDADFIFSPHQFSTYFFINASPQWQSINCGNWLRVEANSRKVANNLGINLEVVTGTEGILSLEGKNITKEIRLQDTRLPVPEHFWKVLRNPQDNSCIAFVSTNNPFLKKRPRTICQDICEKNKWPLLQDNLSKGYVYCCDYQSLLSAVPEMPRLACKTVLRGIL